MRKAKIMPIFTSPLPSGSVAPKKSEVEEQFIYCTAGMKDLESIIQILESRLSPVLRAISSDQDEGDKLAELPLTPLAESIRKMGKDIEFYTIKIRRILGRLEI
jgi:hypothetical protein